MKINLFKQFSRWKDHLRREKLIRNKNLVRKTYREARKEKTEKKYRGRTG